jgi:hypothetical protein
MFYYVLAAWATFHNYFGHTSNSHIKRFLDVLHYISVQEIRQLVKPKSEKSIMDPVDSFKSPLPFLVSG